jgi:replicative DNA helicase
VIAFFSLEMSAEQLATRLISQHAGVSSDKIRRGGIGQDEFDRIFETSRHLHDLSIFIDDTPSLTLPALRTRARRLKRQHGLSLIVVDYLQLMQGPPGFRNENRVQEVSEITRGLKAVAKELNVPVLALSQLSRQPEQRDDKRPLLADLRESGSIEQDADVVMFVYREEYYLERQKPSEGKVEEMLKWQQEMGLVHGKAEVIVGKQRHGPTGTVALTFEAQFTRFSNMARDYQVPDYVG